MRNRIFALLGLLCVVIFSVSAVYIVQDRKFDDPMVGTSDVFSNYNSAHTGKFKVAIIGDSWVSNQKLDKPIGDALLDGGINAEIFSYGHPGAESRQVYRDLISNTSILSDEDITYVVVIAGVNDAAGHMGSDFYVHHIMDIVTALNSRGKMPVLVELPEFDISSPRAKLSGVKAFLYKMLFDGGKTDVISDYRAALYSELSKSDAKYILLPFDPIVSDYSKSKSLYNDSWHLTGDGYALLGTYIGQNIVQQYSRND